MFSWLRSRFKRVPRPVITVTCDPETFEISKQPSGLSHSYRWDDVEKITLICNGLEPWVNDLSYILLMQDGSILEVPNDAINAKQWVNEMLNLPDFNHEFFCFCHGLY